MDKGAVQKIRDDIVIAALEEAGDSGWTQALLEEAAVQAGYEEAMVRAVFPGNVAEALDHFSDIADRQMLKRLAGVNPEDLKIRERVRDALLARYSYLNAHKDAVRKSLVFWAMPLRKFKAAQIVWRTADRIWDWAGDTSENYNRYTKRGLLSGVIVSTTLAWLNFEENDLEQTEKFLERRIENVLQVGKIVGRLKERGRAS